jgi:hypothetical protein
MESKLKTLSTTELESILAKAISTALEEKFNVSITSVDFSRHHGHGGTFSMEIWKEFDAFMSKQ